MTTDGDSGSDTRSAAARRAARVAVLHSRGSHVARFSRARDVRKVPVPRPGRGCASGFDRPLLLAARRNDSTRDSAHHSRARHNDGNTPHGGVLLVGNGGLRGGGARAAHTSREERTLRLSRRKRTGDNSHSRNVRTRRHIRRNLEADALRIRHSAQLV